MANRYSGDDVERMLRPVLKKEGYVLENPPRRRGETGADILARKEGQRTAIECIGYNENPPLRSKQFYESFFRAISRIGPKVHKYAIALPKDFGRGMNQRARQYGESWRRIGEAFPELEIWLVDCEEGGYEPHPWNYWPQKGKKKPVRREPSSGGQNAETGRAGANYGRKCAEGVAAHLGTKLLSGKSNEVRLGGKLGVIKCAHHRTPQIGVSLAMLERVSLIIAAMEEPSAERSAKPSCGRRHKLYRLSPKWYRQRMTPSRSSNASASKVMMVSCSEIRRSKPFDALPEGWDT